MPDFPSPADAAMTFRFEGPLVIATVAAWHRQLQAQLAAAPRCTLDAGPITQADLFGVQLLLAALRSPAGREGRLQLVNPPPALAAVCTAAGIDPALLLAS